MGDTKEPEVPSWQQAQTGSSDSQAPTDQEATLEQARKFLDDESVRSASKERKIEFLKSKGIRSESIEKLLESEAEQAEAESSSTQAFAAPSEAAQNSSSSASNAPPIITYPEFLTHSQRPSPLITPTRLLNLLTASATAVTLLYGASRFLVSPMVETLNESRSEYYSHVNEKVGKLVEQLEGAVSEAPYKNGTIVKPDPDFEDESNYDDPTELFHRDIGTQTSPDLPAASNGQQAADESSVDRQARQLAELSSALKDLQDVYTSRAESTSNVFDSLRDIREDVDKLAYSSMPDYSSFYGSAGFGSSRSTEPDDEFKKTKDAIRSVKGVFLSSRNFPVAATK